MIEVARLFWYKTLGMANRQLCHTAEAAVTSRVAGRQRMQLAGSEGGVAMASEGEEQELWARLRDSVESDPYWSLLGIRVEEISHGYCRLRLPFGKGVPGFGVGRVHNVALASLIEAAVRTAVDSLDMSDMKIHTTAALNVGFLATALEDIVAEGRILQVGNQVAKGEAELRDAAGQLVAKGAVTCVAWSQDEA